MTAAARIEPVRRLRVRVRGAVQGVGFRPFVHALAARHGLAGWVLNDGEGVLLEAEGTDLAAFVDALTREAPPLARVDRVEHEPRPVAGGSGFEIRASGAGAVTTAITADAAVCDACLAELFDPAERRYRYPFVTCTHCGPRYTITRRLPYDRPQTALAGFAMCADCAREYHDPHDRRFHAQPTACPACGPRLAMPVEEILARLRAGEVVAIKGLGGFHLACDARSEPAVAALRARKRREEKPFAVMVASLAAARRLAAIDDASARVLTEWTRPVVLVPRREGDGLAPSVAPGLATLGLMLPYTPIHYLLFHEAAGRPRGTAWLDAPPDLALVMTSANLSDEPLVASNADAARRLAGIAHAIADHDRDIVVRCDDSVLRVSAGAARFLRRARGFVPRPVRLARAVAPVLAVGGHLKNTVCVTRGDEAFVSQHIGDLDNPESIRFFEETVEHLLHVLQVEPVRVAHDRHPDFWSTRYAEGLELPAIPVQHHHAHIAAVVAEHRIAAPVLGLALDGFGLGDDGGAWGGELLRVDGAAFERLGHLAPLAQPGGDRAAREPWRMGAAALHALGRGHEIAARFAGHRAAAGLAQVLERGVSAPGMPMTTSLGRLFDAACGLLGVKPVARYEGQAPMLLEALVRAPRVLAGGWSVADGVLDLKPLLGALIDAAPREGAELFHGTLVAALAEWAAQAAAASGIRTVAMSGGCLLNRVLAEGLTDALAGRGLAPLLPRELPPNDGGLSLGQAWVAALTESTTE